MTKLRKAAVILTILTTILALFAGCSGQDNPSNTSASSQKQESTAAGSRETKDNSTSTAAVSDNSDSLLYGNTEYGFTFALPGSWKGYWIVYSQWQGTGAEGGVDETGPELYIRNPAWTEETPRQDIPIMIFTLDQWNSLSQDKFHIGAAPINPSELGRNSKYVFALPARYNYAFPPGFEEVEKILQGNPLKPAPISQQNTNPAESLISDIMALAKSGKIINSDFSAKTNTMSFTRPEP